LEITPTPDGLITVAQAARLTGRSEKTVWSWTSKGYKAPGGARVRVSVKRRDGWAILLDPVEVAKADLATDPKRRFRPAFPLPAAA
jgi:predicted DNA-binding transcriptional regulator AlpA